MGGQHAAGQIERAADQDARRPVRQWTAWLQRLFERRRGFGGKSLAARGLRQSFGGNGIFLVGNGERHDPVGDAGERAR